MVYLHWDQFPQFGLEPVDLVQWEARWCLFAWTCLGAGCIGAVYGHTVYADNARLFGDMAAFQYYVVYALRYAVDTLKMLEQGIFLAAWLGAHGGAEPTDAATFEAWWREMVRRWPAGDGGGS